MSSNAHASFTDLIGFVEQLIVIHGRLQQGRGRRHRQDALHRAGVVMTVAAWESYVERVILEALDAIEASSDVAGNAQAVPSWARHAFALRRAEIQKQVRRFNTPDAENVRNLFRDTLEFCPWQGWRWNAPRRRWSETQMRARLNDWVLIRHSVAHGFSLPANIQWLRDGQGLPRLNLTLLRECKTFFEHIAQQTDDGFRQFLVQHHGVAAPW